ncbi:1-(5-phosphoribosyl)-5-[(5-phosphoribosylamino)methylideneamino] imidazole-4-carboxamide isomerase [Candidatus Bathyarchaeota archaeon]|nr:1-(5-phosphoribosyl)-5-[(5-phosphoribosylamino)methylideneamino] imidazole-4-carboxamide isomerase [Candidatus Bathyarchaeota archaeon]
MVEDLILIPAVDIMGGKCVRLVQGDPERVKVYYDDPLEPAKLFVDQGAELLHIVDLDAALGFGDNLNAVSRIVREVDVEVQVGGGVRSLERAESLFRIGVSRVVIGTAAIRDPGFLREAVMRFGGERIAGAVDSRRGIVMIEGWKSKSNISYLEYAELLEESGVGSIIFTSVGRDGTLTGPALDEISALVSRVRVQ